MQGSRAEDSSPLIATVQDIQKRLIRPSSLHSPPPISYPDGVSISKFSQFKVNFTEEEETARKKKKKKKLEDFLDPSLLSAISSKVGRVKKVPLPELNKPKKKLVMVKDFEWPVDELNAIVADAKSDQAVDLNNDLEDFVEEQSGEESCTPFQRFEQSALKRFNFKELDQP